MGKLDTFKDIVQTKCPKCREENMFKYKTLNLRNMLKMHWACPKCGQSFMPEPGFYFSAMYISYAINVALMVTSGVAFSVLFDIDNVALMLAAVFLAPVLLSPWNFRISRAIALYTMGGVKRD